MHVSKLFRVLVVGGAALAIEVGCGDEPGKTRVLKTDVVATRLAGDGVGGGDADTDTGNGDAELLPCFCDFQPCCERASAATPTVQNGFVCCWGTVC